jgi:anti-anti-sigma regulatory factor
MAVKTLSDNIISVVLSAEPRTRQELAAVSEETSQKCSFDVIIDFTYVEVLTSSSISNLITLRSWVKGAGRKLVLYKVKVITKCIFDVAGIQSLFEFADDQDEALAIIKKYRLSQQDSAATSSQQAAQGGETFTRSKKRGLFGFHIFKK